MFILRRSSTIFCSTVILATSAFAGQPLETESARTPPKGTVELESTFEYQSSHDGREYAWPFLLEYGITNRLEFALEPVANTTIRPKIGRRASGSGDLEATATYLVRRETSGFPAFALAAEAKFPVTKDRLIGTGETDYAGYLILSRRLSRLDLHANLGYTILGRPAGIVLNNVLSFAVGGEFEASRHWEIAGEIFANTAAAPGLGENENGQPRTPTEQTAELSGGEAFVMVGSRWHLSSSFGLAFGVVYDNNNAVLVRPGVTLKF